MEIRVGSIRYGDFGNVEVSFKLNNSIDIKGVLQDVKFATVDTASIKVEGVNYRIILPMDMKIDLIHPEPGESASNPIRFDWTEYKPEYLGKWCVINHGVMTRQGVLSTYETRHKQGVLNGEEIVSIRDVFIFTGGEMLVVNEVV